jgi:glycosyltransferase involved in cell wall biosynthesis
MLTQINPVYSIILTVHQKQELIERVLRGILDNTTGAYELITVFDGCTDNSYTIYQMVKKEYPQVDFKELHLPNVFEVKANNAGMQAASGDYFILVQDDMQVIEPGWNARLTLPIRSHDKVFAVTSKDAHNYTGDDRLWNNYGNMSTIPRNVFAIRDVVNRGPLALDGAKVKELNYLDEAFAPLCSDDHDLCARAYKEKGWLCGCYWINYISEVGWGTTRQKNQAWHYNIDMRNRQLFFQRHWDYVVSPKHDQDLVLE